MTHGIAYVNSSGSFKGIISVVLSTWSLEGPQPLLFTYLDAVRFRAKMYPTGGMPSYLSDIQIVSAEQARELAVGMFNHVGRKKP